MARFRERQPDKGKSIAAINHSRDLRNQIVALFGGKDWIPSSVMTHKRRPTDGDQDLAVVERGTYDNKANLDKSKNTKLPKSLRVAYRTSGKGPQGRPENVSLSRFPHEIGRSLLLLYTEPNQVVFDPFTGHNSRMEMCVKEKRHYVGCDVSDEFMRHNFRRADVLRNKYPVSITLHQCDSRKVPVPDDSADFTITSPPYWDIEFYGDEPEQLGKQESYKVFLDGLQMVMRENYRVLRDGSHCVWFVNDFRKDGVFHSYHMDTVRRMRRVGFVHTDIVIVDLGRTMRDCFTSQIVKTKIIPKRHEYALVFRKPNQETDK